MKRLFFPLLFIALAASRLSHTGILWTEEGLLRHPSFQGLREDKNPREIVRENPLPAPDRASVGQRLSR